MVLVCRFRLSPNLAGIGEWVAQFLSLHSGLRVAIEQEPDTEDGVSLRVLSSSGDSETVSLAIRTHRPDLTRAGITEIAA
ncbi:MAG: hypothetical protein AAB839_02505 [Patescibacteria group bacterium]